MHEGALLAHIYRRSADLSARFPRLLVGPGDDCAVLDGAPGETLLLTVDQVIEGRHVTGPIGVATPVDLVARKAIARSVSDLAAMGGTPIASLATAALPAAFPQALAKDLFDAMHRWAASWNGPLVGGDVASLGERDAPVVLTVTALGAAHPTRGPVLRSGATPGDAVYVTGRLGGSFASGRHLTFEPRVREGAWLCEILGDRLHAMMDLSDGLGIDASRLARASGAAVEIDAESIPRRGGVGSWPAACRDGEDYELLFTADARADVPEVCAQTGTTITRIGRVVSPPSSGPACVVIDGAVRHDASGLGWEHGPDGARGQ